MTDDRLNKLRAEMEQSIAAYQHGSVKMDPREVLALLDMIDNLQECLEVVQEPQ